MRTSHRAGVFLIRALGTTELREYEPRLRERAGKSTPQRRRCVGQSRSGERNRFNPCPESSTAAGGCRRMAPLRGGLNRGRIAPISPTQSGTRSRRCQTPSMSCARTAAPPIACRRSALRIVQLADSASGRYSTAIRRPSPKAISTATSASPTFPSSSISGRHGAAHAR